MKASLYLSVITWASQDGFKLGVSWCDGLASRAGLRSARHRDELARSGRGPGGPAARAGGPCLSSGCLGGQAATGPADRHRAVVAPRTASSATGAAPADRCSAPMQPSTGGYSPKVIFGNIGKYWFSDLRCLSYFARYIGFHKLLCLKIYHFSLVLGPRIKCNNFMECFF